MHAILREASAHVVTFAAVARHVQMVSCGEQRTHEVSGNAGVGARARACLHDYWRGFVGVDQLEQSGIGELPF